MAPSSALVDLSRLLDWLYPLHCGACGQPLQPSELSLCEACADSLMELEGLRCRRCGVPGLGLCRRCREAPPPFESITSGYVYGGALAQVLRRYKYGRHLEQAPVLARLLLPLLTDRHGVLVPVPASRRALRQRGFDAMAVVLGWVSRLARRSNASVRVSRALRRKDRRPAQAELGAVERRTLSARAFWVHGRRALAGQHVVLVDDVLTTGATARACSAALKLAGVGSVEVVTLARVEGEATLS